MNDHEAAPRINNARKAAARRLQQQYPGMKYIQAYAATAPDAQTWQQFARVGGAVHLQACAIQMSEAARRLFAVAANCSESSERQRLWEGGQFSVRLTTRLVEVETYARTVEVTAPLIPRMETAEWRRCLDRCTTVRTPRSSSYSTKPAISSAVYRPHRRSPPRCRTS